MPDLFNSGGNRLPSYRSDHDALWKEIRKLWLALNKQGGPLNGKEIVYSYSGLLNTITATVTSAPWVAPANISLAACVIGVQYANNAAITANILVAGVNVGSVVLPTYEMVIDKTIDINVVRGQSVQISIPSSSAGSGSHLSVTLRWQEELQL